MLQNKKSEKIIKNQVFNPFLPSWEYIPDGEPHVFGNRVYVYGSHDIFNGWAFCLGDYVCYSAPVTDLSSWRYEEHGFFEATSMRKFGGKYYFIYSSSRQHELCYAVSDSPTENFVYGGILISNCDFNISSYKPENVRIRQGGNNHGSVEYINGEYYVFYHRQTNKTSYSRQACAEKIIMNPNGSFGQAQISSCGLNGGPLVGKGVYPAYIACYLFSDDFTPANFPVITQDGEVLAGIPTHRINFWEEISAPITIPVGVHPIFFTYKGKRTTSIRSFEFI